MRRILLISSSVCYGSGFLDHAETEIRRILRGLSRILFIPYASKDYDAYTDSMQKRFAQMGIGVDAIHLSRKPKQAVSNAHAVFIGGGNTFRLLSSLYNHNLLDAIKKRVSTGMPYIGSSAGTNVACPTIATTNDMPIVFPPSLRALGLVHFQINPHFLSADPTSIHKGETREQRIAEFHEEHSTPVIGLPESSMIRVEGSRITLLGKGGAIAFLPGRKPMKLSSNRRIDLFLNQKDSKNML